MRYYKHNIIILLILLTIVLGKETYGINSIIDKKLNYKLTFKNITAGEGYILIERDSLFNKSILILRSQIKTNNFFDLFYRIRDELTIYMDKFDYSLLKVSNKISEGKFKKDFTSDIDLSLIKISNSEDELPISDKVYSPLSVIFSLREKLLNLGDKFHYTTYNMGKLKNVNISIIGKEIINTSYGTYNTIVVSPKSIDNRSVLRNNGDMKVWFTDDLNRIPIRIEIKINYGSIVLSLEEIEEWDI